MRKALCDGYDSRKVSEVDGIKVHYRLIASKVTYTVYSSKNEIN